MREFRNTVSKNPKPNQKSVKNNKASNSFENTCIPWEYVAQTSLKLSIIDRRQSSEHNKVF